MTKLVEYEEMSNMEDSWVLEWNVIPNSSTTYFTVPNVIFSAETERVPISNPTNVPLYVRKGDLIRTIYKAKLYLGKPMSAEEQERMEQTALLISELVREGMEVVRETKSDTEEVVPETAETPTL